MMNKYFINKFPRLDEYGNYDSDDDKKSYEVNKQFLEDSYKYKVSQEECSKKSKNHKRIFTILRTLEYVITGVLFFTSIQLDLPYLLITALIFFLVSHIGISIAKVIVDNKFENTYSELIILNESGMSLDGSLHLEDYEVTKAYKRIKETHSKFHKKLTIFDTVFDLVPILMFGAIFGIIFYFSFYAPDEINNKYLSIIIMVILVATIIIVGVGKPAIRKVIVNKIKQATKDDYDLIYSKYDELENKEVNSNIDNNGSDDGDSDTSSYPEVYDPDMPLDLEEETESNIQQSNEVIRKYLELKASSDSKESKTFKGKFKNIKGLFIVLYFIAVFIIFLVSMIQYENTNDKNFLIVGLTFFFSIFVFVFGYLIFSFIKRKLNMRIDKDARSRTGYVVDYRQVSTTTVNGRLTSSLYEYEIVDELDYTKGLRSYVKNTVYTVGTKVKYKPCRNTKYCKIECDIYDNGSSTYGLDPLAVDRHLEDKDKNSLSYKNSKMNSSSTTYKPSNLSTPERDYSDGNSLIYEDEKEVKKKIKEKKKKSKDRNEMEF